MGPRSLALAATAALVALVWFGLAAGDLPRRPAGAALGSREVSAASRGDAAAAALERPQVSRPSLDEAPPRAGSSGNRVAVDAAAKRAAAVLVLGLEDGPTRHHIRFGFEDVALYCMDGEREVRFATRRANGLLRDKALQAVARPEADLEFTLTEPAYEVDPEAPRGVPLRVGISGTRAPEGAPKERWAGAATVTLTDAPFQRVEVVCWRADPWVAGRVRGADTGPGGIARIELMERDVLRPEALNDLSALTRFEAAALGQVLADGRFWIPAPQRALLPRLRLRCVHDDGRAVVVPGDFAAFDGEVEVDLDLRRRVTGRLTFHGAAATGLASVHAEARGARVGETTLDADGRFEVTEVPEGAFDLVVVSARPGGELIRIPSTAFATSPTNHAHVGVIEVAGHANVMELEVVDAGGRVVGALLRWRGRGGSGSARLDVAPRHVLLVPPVLPYELEVAPVAPQEGDPQPLIAGAGVRRVVLGE